MAIGQVTDLDSNAHHNTDNNRCPYPLPRLATTEQTCVERICAEQMCDSICRVRFLNASKAAVAADDRKEQSMVLN